jgi:hypothetical protein
MYSNQYSVAELASDAGKALQYQPDRCDAIESDQLSYDQSGD